jgi:hypothetical protein
VSLLAAPGAQLLLEFPDLGALAEKGDFSVIWEQHVNYFDLPVIRPLMARFGLRIDSARRVPHGGGALVLFLGRDGEPAGGPAPTFLPTPRAELKASLTRNIATVQGAMARLQGEGRRIMGFGAGMRGTMLINLAGIGPALECVLDDNPDKVGRFLPGSRLPIVATQRLRDQPPDYCLLLPLNAKESERAIMARFPEFLAAGGRFIETLPGQGGFLRVRP